MSEIFERQKFKKQQKNRKRREEKNNNVRGVGAKKNSFKNHKKK